MTEVKLVAKAYKTSLSVEQPANVPVERGNRMGGSRNSLLVVSNASVKQRGARVELLTRGVIHNGD